MSIGPHKILLQMFKVSKVVTKSVYMKVRQLSA